MVVAKALTEDALDRGVSEVFAEADALGELKHPGIVGFIDCGYINLRRR